jgi:hypothetical protein
MYNIRFRLIPLVTALAVHPALSHSKPADIALDACARQVVGDVAARQGLQPKYSVTLKDDPLLSLPASADVYRFTLEARDPKTGSIVARAECDAAHDGKVISYRTLPLIKEPATLAKNR